MADKILQTRIKLKYDTLTHWEQNNPYLLDGEIAVIAVETKEAVGQVNGTKPPQILFKVGAIKDSSQTDPGFKYYHFNELPWASGLSADVYDWAKASTKPTYAASEITGLKEFVEEHSDFDTNTTYKIITGSKTGMYQLQKKELKGNWVNEGTEFGIDENAIKNLITKAQSKADDAYKLAETKAAKTEAIGTVTQTGVASNQIKVAAVSGTSKNETITINNVAHATNADNATNVNLSSEGSVNATVKIQAGSGTAAEFTVNNVAHATNADNATNATNVKLSNSGSTTDKITIKAGSGATTFTVNNVAEAGHATKATQDNSGHDIVATYATKDELRQQIAGSVQYLGLIHTLDDIGTFPLEFGEGFEIGRGDYYRVASDITLKMLTKANEVHFEPNSTGDSYKAVRVQRGFADLIGIEDKNGTHRFDETGVISEVDTATAKFKFDDGSTTSLQTAKTLNDAPVIIPTPSTYAGQFRQLHAGDLLVAATNKPVAEEGETGYYVVHGEEVGVVEIMQGKGIKVIDGTSTNPTIEHAPAGKTATTVIQSGQFIKSIEYDEFGHITNATTGVVSTHDSQFKNVIGTQNATGNSAVTDPYLNLIKDENKSVSTHQIKGAGSVSIASDVNGNITITGADTTVKKINTTNTNTLDTNASESIAGSGIINLHKISKTGNYNDLLNKPTISNKTITVVSGNGLSGTNQSFTLNGSDKTITLNVGAGNGISVTADSIAVKGSTGITVNASGVSVNNYSKFLMRADNNRLVDTANVNVIIDCGSSSTVI